MEPGALWCSSSSAMPLSVSCGGSRFQAQSSGSALPLLPHSSVRCWQETWLPFPPEGSCYRHTCNVQLDLNPKRHCP